MIQFGSEYFHDDNNKVKPCPYGVCVQQPYHPGCAQVTDPEGYCLRMDDPAFCKTVGDICDADGSADPEDRIAKKRS